MLTKARRSYKATLIIPFSDVDMAGVVYTAKFTEYILRGWEDYFRFLGIPWESYVGGDKIKGLPVLRVGLELKSPVRCGEEVEITTTISRLIKRRIYFRFKLFNKTSRKLAATGLLVVAAFDGNYRATNIPDFIVNAITGKHC
jgi:YbgC/YbaW family acyl-CoA thioester hydrolase